MGSEDIWEFPKIRGTLVWGPYNKDPIISDTILGSPIFGNSHIAVNGPSDLLGCLAPGRSMASESCDEVSWATATAGIRTRHDQRCVK